MVKEANLLGMDKRATGRRIGFLIRHQGKTIREISEKMELTYQCVYKWIKGETFPDVDNFWILSRVLGVRVDDLMVGFGKTGVDGTLFDRMTFYCIILGIPVSLA